MAAASTSTSVRNKGKTEFVQEVLRKNPKANTTAVNEAWTEAGREGAISATLVNKQRAAMGFAGNLRASNKSRTSSPPGSATASPGAKTSRKQGASPVASALHGQASSNGSNMAHAATSERSAKATDRLGLLEELEADLDRLLFKVMGMGNLSAVENSLRQTRRLLYGSFSG